MARALTIAERAVVRTAAVWLADEMVGALSDGWGTPSVEEMHDIGQSNFELGCIALDWLSVFASTTRNTWRPLISRDEIGAHVEALDLTTRYLSPVLNAVISPGEHEHVMISRLHPLGWDKRSKEFEDLIGALEAADYLERDETGAFFWSDDLLPWLINQSLGDFSEVEAAPVDEARAVIARLPEDAREFLKGCRFEDGFMRVFCSSWCGPDGWRAAPAENVPMAEWDMALCVSVHAELHGGAG